jgi:hypothetical protein
MLLWVPEPVCQTTRGNGLADRLAEPRIERAQADIHPRGCELDHAEGANERDRHALAADLEVLQRTLGLRPPIALRRHLDRPEAVGLDPHLALAAHGPSSALDRLGA